MPIVQADLKFYKSLVVGNDDTNGGRISATQITSGAASNVFPAVQNAERVTGSTKYRKVFLKNANDDDDELLMSKVYLDNYTAGDDIVTFFPVTQELTQGSITGSERQYGCGKLDVNAAATDTEIDVLVEDGAVEIFQDYDLIRITDMADIDSAGNEEFVTITNISIVDDVVTITFTPALENAYLASAGRVMSVYEATYRDGTVSANINAASFSQVLSTNGDFDPDQIVNDNISAVQQIWTLTFTGASAYGVVGDTLGSIGTSNTASTFAPNNPDFTKPYFTIPPACFSGTFEAGDYIIFETVPSAIPVFMKRVVPAGADPLIPNTAVIVLDGETA